MNRLVKAYKAIRDLGFVKLWQYTRYQVGLHSGYTRLKTPSYHDHFTGRPDLPPFTSFPTISSDHQTQTRIEADEILRGSVRLFGHTLAPLDLTIGASHQHWTVLEKTPPDRDIKFIWEPARFGWAISLARAFAFSGDPAYADDFWKKTQRFLASHPPNLGRQWGSGQEVALRLMVLVFCDRVFASAPTTTEGQRSRLWRAIAEHAARIPPTLAYARSQNNNHLLSEAAGLYTAGVYLRSHPLAKNWLKDGWHWLNWAFQHQIDEFGTYIQHSVNYHRLMLQLGLYCDHLRREWDSPEWPAKTKARLGAATNWLWALTDPHTGKAPNLGANDSAYIFPLTALPYSDYRPVVDAAGKAFLGEDIYSQPSLSEMADWFDLSAPGSPDRKQPQAADMLRVETGPGRGFVRAGQYTDRPSHADQLHVDLWWGGINITPDPGTYQYNAPPPWDNALAGTQTHNTLRINQQDQMLRAGRFLWLDWAQAEVLGYEMDDQGSLKWVSTEHHGYRKLGLIHQRKVSSLANGWLVTDAIAPWDNLREGTCQVELTWLLQDWAWSLEDECRLYFSGPDLGVELKLEGLSQINIIRAGQCLLGNIQPKPTWGWISTTYAKKEPALMLVGTCSGALPIKLQSTFTIK